MHEKESRVHGGTPDIETGQILILKRCPCPIAFCNYKCLNIGLSPSSSVFYTFTFNESELFLHADGGLILRPAT
jgi:hypothetical protein